MESSVYANARAWACNLYIIYYKAYLCNSHELISCPIRKEECILIDKAKSDISFKYHEWDLFVSRKNNKCAFILSCLKLALK